MRWPGSLFRRTPAAGGAHAAALAAYRALEQPNLRGPLAAQRVVVVDVESSGLNPFQDRLISIGAIAVCGGRVPLDESFEVVLRQEQPSDTRNILVHGIGGSDQLAGRDPAAGLIDFLAFAGKAPLVAFHAQFDRVLIERASSAALGVKPGNVWLDLALIAPALYPDRAASARNLDDWLRIFGIEDYSRHCALADALATAQLLLVLLTAAAREGMDTWEQVISLQNAQRWLGGFQPVRGP